MKMYGNEHPISTRVVGLCLLLLSAWSCSVVVTATTYEPPGILRESKAVRRVICDPMNYSDPYSKDRAISFCENGIRRNGGSLTPLSIPWNSDALELTATRDFQIRSCGSETCTWPTHYTVSALMDGQTDMVLTHESRRYTVPVTIVFQQINKNLQKPLPNETARVCAGTGGSLNMCPFYGAGRFPGGEIDDDDDDEYIPNQDCRACLPVRLKVMISRKTMEESGQLRAGLYKGRLQLKVLQAEKSNNINNRPDSGKTNTIGLTIEFRVPDLVRINHLEDVRLVPPYYRHRQTICIYRNRDDHVRIVAHGQNDHDNRFWLSPVSLQRQCNWKVGECVNYRVQLRQQWTTRYLTPGVVDSDFKGSVSTNCATGDNVEMIIDAPDAETMPVDTYVDTLTIMVAPD